MRYIVECFNDECLLEAFGIQWYDINHKYSQGKSAVFKILSKEKKRIGIIDHDEFIESEYFERCVPVLQISDNITIYFEEVNKNKLIVIAPKIESLFVKITIQTNSIDTAKRLGFNNTEGNYHNIRSDKNKLNRLRNLLQTLIQRSVELQKLQENL